MPILLHLRTIEGSDRHGCNEHAMANAPFQCLRRTGPLSKTLLETWRPTYGLYEFCSGDGFCRGNGGVGVVICMHTGHGLSFPGFWERVNEDQLERAWENSRGLHVPNTKKTILLEQTAWPLQSQASLKREDYHLLARVPSAKCICLSLG